MEATVRPTYASSSRRQPATSATMAMQIRTRMGMHDAVRVEFADWLLAFATVPHTTSSVWKGRWREMTTSRVKPRGEAKKLYSFAAKLYRFAVELYRSAAKLRADAANGRADAEKLRTNAAKLRTNAAKLRAGAANGRADATNLRADATEASPYAANLPAAAAKRSALCEGLSGSDRKPSGFCAPSVQAGGHST